MKAMHPLLCIALPPASGGSIESAVGSFDAGQPSSRRTSLGDSTPARPRAPPRRPSRIGIGLQQVVEVYHKSKFRRQDRTRRVRPARRSGRTFFIVVQTEPATCSDVVSDIHLKVAP
jgi:hypothetical protein